MSRDHSDDLDDDAGAWDPRRHDALHASPDARAVALIERDAYDEAAFARVRQASADLQRLIDTGARLAPHFEALVHDLFCLLFKYGVSRRSPVPTSALLAARVLDWIETSGGFALLKAETTLDEVRAGFVCTMLTGRVLALLRDPELFSSEELLEAFRAAELERALDEARAELTAAQELREAREAAREAGADGTVEHDDEHEDAPSVARTAAQAAGAGQLERVAERIRAEVGELERGLAALRKAQARRLEQLPVAGGEGRLRAAVETLPERLQHDEAAAETFVQAVGGAGESLAAQARLELGERLLGAEKVARLARLVGAFRQVALGVRRRRFERCSAELHSLERSGELSRILPSELVGMRHPLMRREFRRRLVESQLMTYAVESEDRAGRGPMIVLLDGSGSMHGPRELWAKAVSLALLELCRRQRRAFHAIVFSAGREATRRFQLTGEREARSLGAPPVDYARLIDFAEYFPRGGTRFEHPIEQAVHILDTESRFRRGDVVLVTDGEAVLPPAWCAWFEAERSRLGFKLHAVLVDVGGAGRRSTLEEIADTVSPITELTADAARGLYEAL